MGTVVGIIYCATDSTNGKKYVGLTVRDITGVKNRHSVACTYFGNSYRAHGPENFTWEKIDEAFSYEELGQKEIFWIKELDTLHPNGYNISSGGFKYEGRPLGKARDPVTCLAISLSKVGRKTRPHTPETKLKIALAAKAREKRRKDFIAECDAKFKATQLALTS